MSADPVSGARLLRLLREKRGWSWNDLARALRDTARRLALASPAPRQLASIQRAVARWESTAGRTRPGERYQFLLAHLYALTPGGEVELGPGSDFEVLLDALRHFGLSTDRERQLVELVTCSSTHQAGPDEVHRLRESVTEISGQIGAVSFVKLQLRLVTVLESCRRLLRTGHDGGTDVVPLAVDAFALAGRLAFETHDDESAMNLYAEATKTAARLADHGKRTAVRTSHAMVVLHATNDLAAAERLVAQAVADASRSDSQAVRARAYAIRAEIQARAGHGDGAVAALELAAESLAQVMPGDPHAAFGADHLRGFEGVCALKAGAAEHAHDVLGRSLDALADKESVQRGIVSVDLALARLRLGELEASVDLLHQVVDVVAATGGRVAAQRLRSARRELRPYREEPVVVGLDDHIHDALIGR